jgi:ParB family chromosome partitioning protein
MSSKPFQLGKGLSSLIPSKKSEGSNFWGGNNQVSDTSALHQVGEIKQMEIKNINPNPQQPRHHFDHNSLEDLVGSIKVHGILQPLIVTPRSDGRYDLITGERRLRAAQIASFDTVPAIIREVRQQESLELALVENLQRQDLNPMEEAEAYIRLHNEFDLTQEKIAKQVGKSRAQVANTMRLLDLSPAIQDALRQGIITFGHAKVILSVENKTEQEKLFSVIVKEGLPVRLAETKVQKVRVRGHERKMSIDSELKAWENELQHALGTKVKIKGTKHAGAIEVIFYSIQELVVLVKKLLKKD